MKALAAYAAGILLLMGEAAYAGPPVTVQDPSNVNRNMAVNSDGSINVTVTGGGGGGSSYAQGSTTAGQNVNPMGCRTLSSLPTDTTARTNMPACTTSGELSTHDASVLAAVQAAIPAGTNLIGKVGIDQTTPGTTNGVVVNSIAAGSNIIGKVSVDQTTPGTTNAVQNIAGTTGGTTPFTLTAAASTNATNIKASAGLVDHVSVYNISATPAWVSFYDTSATPTCGTSIKYQVLAPANSTSGAGAVEDYAIGVGHASGIGICVTTGIAGTGAVAASSYVVNVFYK